MWWFLTVFNGGAAAANLWLVVGGSLFSIPFFILSSIVAAYSLARALDD